MSDFTNKAQGASGTEPTATTLTTPLWLVALLFILFFGAAWMFDQRGGWFNKQVYAPYGSEDRLSRFQPPAEDLPPEYVRGKKLYEVCAACHLANGLGSPSVGAPPLVDSEWVLAPGPNRIIRIVLDGLSGPLKVKGQQYGSGVMTGFRPALNDQQIADVLTYIRMSRDWKHNASPVSAEQVKAVREATPDRSSNWTEAELLAIPEN
jgi:mono/diheme cytochrome c family protein